MMANMNTISEKLKALRAELKNQDVAGFIVPRADEYQGEFVAPYAERLAWITGFTGSAGVAVILDDKVLVQSDGRYTLQLKQEVDQSCYEISDMIKEPLENWLNENAKGKVIGYSPWLHTPAQIERLSKAGVVLKPLESNPLDTIWSAQPIRGSSQIEIFPEAISGLSVAAKKAYIEDCLKEAGAQSCILSLPDSICWLLNMRGADIPCTPAILSYAVIYADGRPIDWVIEPSRLPENIHQAMAEIFTCKAPEYLPDLMTHLPEPVMIDESHAPIWFKQSLELLSKEVIAKADPCIAPKACKTEREAEAMKKAHEIDALALVKFMHWLDAHAQNKTECEIADKLLEFRKQNPAFRDESFPAICGFASNGAIIHYRAQEKSCAKIQGQGLLLLDSGAQYLDAENAIAGTTDITRTMAIGGAPTAEEKLRFTQVLKGHIAVARARFPYGSVGAQIDALARAPLWADGVDFAHGTGHGVGCYLAVHEEAASISPRGKTAFEAGMIISNEPGYYKAGAFGIRTENLILTKDSEQLCDGTGAAMLEFETISFAPFDRKLIDIALLNDDERTWLNDYHKKCCEIVAPQLDDTDCVAWLEQAAQPL